MNMSLKHIPKQITKYIPKYIPKYMPKYIHKYIPKYITQNILRNIPGNNKRFPVATSLVPPLSRLIAQACDGACRVAAARVANRPSAFIFYIAYSIHVPKCTQTIV